MVFRGACSSWLRDFFDDWWYCSIVLIFEFISVLLVITTVVSEYILVIQFYFLISVSGRDFSTWSNNTRRIRLVDEYHLIAINQIWWRCLFVLPWIQISKQCLYVCLAAMRMVVLHQRECVFRFWISMTLFFILDLNAALEIPNFIAQVDGARRSMSCDPMNFIELWFFHVAL